ncbi:MAG: hypothetical protein LUE86_00515 [Clostridiales bacterium]|nr:hypothetical protein [Clostridiales bacterium]
MEECAEISQAASKAIRFGVKNINPYTSDTTNAEDIMQEFLQLSAVIGELQKDGVLPVYGKYTEDEIKAEKLEKIAKYSHKTDVQDSPADSTIDSTIISETDHPSNIKCGCTGIRLKEIQVGMAIHPATEIEATVLLEYLDNMGYRWLDGTPLRGETFYSSKKGGAYYWIRLDKEVCYSDRKLAVKQKKQIVELSALVESEDSIVDSNR